MLLLHVLRVPLLLTNDKEIQHMILKEKKTEKKKHWIRMNPDHNPGRLIKSGDGSHIRLASKFVFFFPFPRWFNWNFSLWFLCFYFCLIFWFGLKWSEIVVSSLATHLKVETFFLFNIFQWINSIFLFIVLFFFLVTMSLPLSTIIPQHLFLFSLNTFIVPC